MDALVGKQPCIVFGMHDVNDDEESVRIYLPQNFIMKEIAKICSAYKASWALPTPGRRNKTGGHRHKNKNITKQRELWANVSRALCFQCCFLRILLLYYFLIVFVLI